jgi:hypothetical protein
MAALGRLHRFIGVMPMTGIEHQAAEFQILTRARRIDIPKFEASIEQGHISCRPSASAKV